MAVKLSSKSRPSLVEEVVQRLRAFIETSALQAGDRLPAEPELLERFRVSRTVLREAISRLDMIGLVQVQHGRGMFVGDRKSLSTTAQLVRTAMMISPHDLLKSLDLRRAIETASVRKAAELADANDLRELDALFARMHAPDLKLAESMRFDFQFHLRIVEAGRNELMRNVLEVLQEFIFAAMIQTLEQPGLPPSPGDIHREMLEAVRAHDADRAERAVHAHMDLVDARLKFVLERRESAGAGTPAVVERAQA